MRTWWENARNYRRMRDAAASLPAPTSLSIPPPECIADAAPFTRPFTGSSYGLYQARNGDGPGSMLGAASIVEHGPYNALPAVAPWTAEAWEYYDEIPELRTGSQWLSAALSRVRLYVGLTEMDSASTPTPINPDATDATDEDRRAVAVLGELFGGPTGQSQSLARLAQHLSIPGESYICAWEQDGTVQWHVASRDEVSAVGASIQLNLTGDQQRINIRPVGTQAPDRANRRGSLTTNVPGMVMRLWRPHARYTWQADSPVRPLRGALREMRGASAHIGASLDSRLAGAGVLLLPHSASVPGARLGPDGKPLNADPVVAALIDTMGTPLKNPNSAAALVPLVIRVNDVALGHIQHLKFSTPLDDRVLDIRDSSKQRVAMALDVPQEELLGKGDLNHWTGWQVSEEAVSQIVSPICETIVAALTERWFRSRLRQIGISDPTRYLVHFDTKQLTQRPNKGGEASTYHDKLLLSDTAARLSGGWSDDDAPDAAEVRRRLLTVLMQKGVPMETARPYLLELGIDLDTPAVETTTGRPELEQAPTTTPDQDQAPGPAEPEEARELPQTPGSPDNSQQPGALAAALTRGSR